MKTETLNFNTANGATTAFAAMPDEITDDTKAIILVQEWWGLNDHIKDIATRYADEGFIAIAPDLYRGKLAANPQEAGKYMQELQLEDGLATIDEAIKTASEKYGKKEFGITGYCMGGTYSLQAACKLENLHAAAPFYGDTPDEFTLKGLKCPVLFISGTKDGWINTEKVAELERVAKANNLPIESVAYEADHAFFNNTRPEVYDEEAAKDAWHRVLEFFKKNL
ncbi:MAG TPA: dienelactone hydrolase family protein [Pyrinomonadaceae bacterium]|nr:dienelactone hydrolase family protein [Pyrinomonadaceae bacterium]